MSTTSTVFSRIPQPMNGINWEPSPSNYTSIPAPNEYGDTDFANDDFEALWGMQGSPPTGRNDLQTIAEMGANTIKMYNWSVPQPDGYWMRNHKGFLAAAKAQGLSVIIPISNFFTGTAYNNRTKGNNSAGPPASADLKQWIQEIVAEVYSGTPATAGPAIMWAIGNEYDNSNVGAYGYCEAQDIATVAQYIVDAETALGIADDDVLAFTSPVTTALMPVNTSIHCSHPWNMVMGACAIQDLLAWLGVALAPRFIASVNSYQTGTQLTQYASDFATLFSGRPWFYGELGWSAGIGGDALQAQNVYNQFTTTIPLATPGSNYYGACAFEFSDELWKGPAGSTETMFGLYTFPDPTSPPTAPPTATEGDHSPVWGASYPVDELVPRTAAGCLTAAFKGTTPAPTGCGSSS